MKILKSKYLSFVLTVLVVSACNGQKSSKVLTDILETSDFSGISSVSNKTDSTVTISWTPHKDAVSYDIFNIVSGSSGLIQSVTNKDLSEVTLRGLAPSTQYRFLVSMKNSEGDYDGNIQSISVTTNAAPNAPSALSLISSSVAGADLTVTHSVRVSGVKTGDTVKLFSDSTCSTELASGVVGSDSTTIDLTSPKLIPNNYRFYASASNDVPASSACSTASAVYSLNGCPEGYISIQPNNDVGTTAAFCVMKYEARAMKNDTGDVYVGGCGDPTGLTCPGANDDWATLYHPANGLEGYRPASVENEAPWRKISKAKAKEACTNLGEGYDLISNPEWMTIARAIEQIPTNWSNSTISTSESMNIGVYLSHTSPLRSTADCLSPPSANTCGTNGPFLAKRTHRVSTTSSDVIWDLAGNNAEWVDWSVDQTEKASASVSTTGTSWNNFEEVDTKAGINDVMNPATWKSLLLETMSIESANGLGRLRSNHTGGTDVRRGGTRNNDTNAGIFAIEVGLSGAHTTTGFRCVYRP